MIIYIESDTNGFDKAWEMGEVVDEQESFITKILHGVTYIWNGDENHAVVVILP